MEAAPSAASLRRLFRLVDKDGSRFLSHNEFRIALEGLGVVLDPAAFSAMLQEVDCDRSGTITEAEFVRYFQNKQLGDLTKIFSNVRSEIAPVNIVVVTYGSGDGGQRPVEFAKLTPVHFELWLRNELPALTARGRQVWIDVCGEDRSVLGLLSRTFGLPSDILCDAMIYQRQKLELVPLLEVGAAAQPSVESLTQPVNKGTGAARARQPSRRRTASEASDASSTCSPPPAVQMVFHAMSLTNPPVHKKVYYAQLGRQMERLHCGRAARSLGLMADLDEHNARAAAAAAAATATAQAAAAWRSGHPSQRGLHSVSGSRRGSIHDSALAAARELAAEIGGADPTDEAPLGDDEGPAASAPAAGDATYVPEKPSGGPAAAAASSSSSPPHPRPLPSPVSTRVKLVAPPVLQRTPPAVHVEQAVLFVVSDSVLVSLQAGPSETRLGAGSSGGRGDGDKAALLSRLSKASARSARVALQQVLPLPQLRSGWVPGDDAKGGGAGAGQGSGGTAPPGAARPAAQQPGTVVGILLHAVRHRLQAEAAASSPAAAFSSSSTSLSGAEAAAVGVKPTPSSLLSSSVHGLAVEILWVLHQFNLGVRDQLTDWHELLERSVSNPVPSQLTMPHAYALEKTADAYARALEPLRCALDPREWPDGSDALLLRRARGGQQAVEGHDGDGETPALPPDRSASFRRRVSFRSVPSDAGGSAATGRPFRVLHTLGTLFLDELPAFQRLAGSVDDLYQDVRGLVTSSRALRDVHKAHQDDRRNTVLYILTMLSGLAIPISATTGYFGMNFLDMTELDPASNLPLSGVAVFWATLLTTLFVLVLVVYRQRVLELA